MAETVNSSSEAEERRELERIVPVLGSPRQHGVVYGGRFTIAYLILVLVFGGVAALFTYLVVRGDPPAWSAYTPKGEGLARATDIANHVSKSYRAGGQQIAVVEAQPPMVQNTPIDIVAVSRDVLQAVGGGYISVEPANRSLFYVFCGLGRACALRRSDVSPTLLRRESLELALYTFKYMSRIDSVIALLPPRGEETEAIYLRRRSLETFLGKPLHETLPGSVAGDPLFTSASIIDGPEVDKLTRHRQFPAYFQRISNGSVMLRLGGPPPPEAEQQGGPAQTP